MATIRATVTDRLDEYGITLTEVGLDTLLIKAGLADGAADYATAITATETAILTRLERIVTQPDVTEGGYSVKYDRKAITAYCVQLRLDLGLPALTTAPIAKVIDRSNLW